MVDHFPFGGENREPDLTTPDAVRLHQELYNMYEKWGEGGGP